MTSHNQLTYVFLVVVRCPNDPRQDAPYQVVIQAEKMPIGIDVIQILRDQFHETSVYKDWGMTVEAVDIVKPSAPRVFPL